MKRSLQFLLAMVFLIALSIWPVLISAQVVNEENNPEASESGTFDLSPDQRDPNEYNLMPLVINSGVSADKRINLLANMVSDQGYEAHCAQKEWSIDPVAWGTIAEYFQNFSDPQRFYGTDIYHANFEAARIPLMRGMEDGALTDKNDSFEGMFGANLQTVFNEDDYQNATGVTGRLLSSYWQCYYKKNNLDVIEKLCDKFFDKCFLDKEIQIPADPLTGISAQTFTYLGVKKRLDKMHPELKNAERSELNSAICSDLYGDPNALAEAEAVASEIDNKKDLDLSRLAIERVNFDLDNLYRLAFLILVPRQSTAANKLSFQASPGGENGKDAPIFIAFKIPEFGTNKSRTLGNVDSLELSKLVLQNEQQNQQDFDDQEAWRDQLFEIAKTVDGRNASDKTIQCGKDSDCVRSDANVLKNVLVDIVNATAPDCTVDNISVIDLVGTDDPANSNANIDNIINSPDIHFERAGDLFTPAIALIEGTAGNMYKNDLFVGNASLVESIPSKDEGNNFSWDVTIASPNPDLGEQIRVRAYLVLPVGENIKDVNKSLGVFWSKDAFLELVKNNVLVDMENKTGAIPKYYTIKGSDVRFNDSDSYPWQTECHDEPVYDSNGDPMNDEEGNPMLETVCTDSTFGVNVKDSRKEELLFPDFGLGWLIRKIQTTIRSTADATFEYIDSCERVEDLFLGRCGRRSGAGELSAMCDGETFSKIEGLPSYDNILEKAKADFTNNIATRVTQELIDAYGQAQAATGIPCEVIAGIHYREGGMNPNQSIHDGGALRGTLAEDAISAMEILKAKLDMQNVPAAEMQLTYEDLVKALAYYNGPGNANCSSNEAGPRPTRWQLNGQCPPDFYGDDHLYPNNWIDEAHQEMDLIFCMDAVEFTCTRQSNSSDYNAIKQRYEAVMGRVPSDEFIEQAMNMCFIGGPACIGSLTNNNANKYPSFNSPGVMTIAIIMHNFENPILQDSDN